jgi:hypothetical protein
MDSILQGSDDGVLQFGLLSFWTFSIVQYFLEQNVSETESVSIWRRGAGGTFSAGSSD